MTARGAKGRAREQLIVQAAGEAIAELGLANVRVSDVAERANMTPGHVTYYFPSKTHLLILAIRQSEQELVSAAEKQLNSIPDPWARLERLIHLSAAQRQGDAGWVLWMEVWSGAVLDPEVTRVCDELDAQWRQILKSVIDYGVEQGVFETVNSADAAFVLSAMIDGLSIQLTVGSANFTRAKLRRLARQAAEAVLLR